MKIICDEDVYDSGGMYDQPSAVEAATLMIPHQAYVIAQKFEFLPANCKEKEPSAQVVTFLSGTFRELLEYLCDALLMRIR